MLLRHLFNNVFSSFFDDFFILRYVCKNIKSISKIPNAILYLTIDLLKAEVMLCMGVVQ